MIVAGQANVFPPKWCNICHCRFWDLFASLAQRSDCFGEIDGVPGGNGSHEQVETTGSMDLIFQSAIAQFPPGDRRKVGGRARAMLLLC
jgi:hypothetical protein